MDQQNNPETQSTEESGSKEEIQIGLWGGPGSGKTHYVATLYMDIRGRQGFTIEELPDSDRFHSYGDLLSSYTNAQDDESLSDGAMALEDEPLYASDLGDRFLNEPKWLERTRPGPEGIRAYRFRIHREAEIVQGRSRQVVADSLLLTLTDAGGEWYRHPRTMLRKYGRAFKEANKTTPIDLLSQCDGIVCLFDSAVAVEGSVAVVDSTIAVEQTSDWSKIEPENRPLTRVELPGAFRELCRLLRERKPGKHGNLAQPIAVCLSKIDRPGLWERRENPKELEAWASTYLPGLPEEVNNACERDLNLWCGISVLGVTINRAGEPISPTDEDNQIRKDVPIRPYNLCRPIGWLASVISKKDYWKVP